MRLLELIKTTFVPRPTCQDKDCPSYGDPDFGEGTCPADHALRDGEVMDKSWP
jgi:hypothetical protein